MTSNSGHCIHQLLPPTKVLPMKLRDSHCVFALPQCHYNLYKHSFVRRNLFVTAYWFDVRCHCIFCIFLFWFSAHAMLCLQLADGVWPSFIKRITYLLTFFAFCQSLLTNTMVMTMMMMMMMCNNCAAISYLFGIFFNKVQLLLLDLYFIQKLLTFFLDHSIGMGIGTDGCSLSAWHLR